MFASGNKFNMDIAFADTKTKLCSSVKHYKCMCVLVFLLRSSVARLEVKIQVKEVLTKRNIALIRNVTLHSLHIAFVAEMNCSASKIGHSMLLTFLVCWVGAASMRTYYSKAHTSARFLFFSHTFFRIKLKLNTNSL